MHLKVMNDAGADITSSHSSMDRISDSGSDDWGSTPHGRTTIMKFKAMCHQLIHRLVASIANFIPGGAWTGLANTLLAHGAFKITVYCDFGLIRWRKGWCLLKNHSVL